MARERALQPMGMSKNLKADFRYPVRAKCWSLGRILQRGLAMLFSEIDDHPTPDFSCEDFARQRWHVVQSCVSRHAVELCEIEVDC
jgi:hypothetical protein